MITPLFRYRPVNGYVGAIDDRARMLRAEDGRYVLYDVALQHIQELERRLEAKS